MITLEIRPDEIIATGIEPKKKSIVKPSHNEEAEIEAKAIVAVKTRSGRLVKPVVRLGQT